MELSSSLAQLADNLLGGALEANLRDWRASGTSWDDMARNLWLATDRKCAPTGPTVQSWARQLGIKDPERASS